MITRVHQTAQAQPVSAMPVEIKADKIDFPRRNVVHLRGYTQLIRGGHRVYADELIFDKNEQQVVARGVVTLETPNGDLIKTSVLRYNMSQNQMRSGPAEFLLANRDAQLIRASGGYVSGHGTAEEVVFEQGTNVMKLNGVKLTTCLDGKDDFKFAADELKVDLNKGLRIAKRAKLQILKPDRHRQLELIN